MGGQQQCHCLLKGPPAHDITISPGLTFLRPSLARGGVRLATMGTWHIFVRQKPSASHKVGSSWPRGASFDFRDNATFVFGLVAGTVRTCATPSCYTRPGPYHVKSCACRSTRLNPSVSPCRALCPQPRSAVFQRVFCTVWKKTLQMGRCRVYGTPW